MKSVLILTVIAIPIFVACNPKSYCFFNVRERTVYITDKSSDNIKTATIRAESSTFKKRVSLNPASKSFKIVEDSILNQNASIFIITTNQNWYSLKLSENDWSKDTVLRCRYLIR